MACVVVPAVEAIVTTVAAKALERKEKNQGAAAGKEGRIAFSRKLKWLNNMLWGGSALLAFEHVWHGEIVPWFPFLTAAAAPEDAALMLREMATAGVAMAVLVTAAWAGMVAVSNVMEKHGTRAARMEEGGVQ